MLNKEGEPSSEVQGPGIVVWRLVSFVRKTKVHLSASFRDKRLKFAGEDFYVQTGIVSRLELNTEEPHPSCRFCSLFYRELMRFYTWSGRADDHCWSRRLDPLRLACVAAAPSSAVAAPSTSAAPTRITTQNLRGQSYLIYCTEWESGHGGLMERLTEKSCTMLADLGADVFLRMVRHGTGQRDLNHDTLLHLSRSVPLTLEPSPVKLGALNPNVVIGHDRISAPKCMQEFENFFPDAKRVLFVHTDPRIEAFGDAGDARRISP